FCGHCRKPLARDRRMSLTPVAFGVSTPIGSKRLENAWLSARMNRCLKGGATALVGEQARSADEQYQAGQQRRDAAGMDATLRRVGERTHERESAGGKIHCPRRRAHRHV